jgi:hypothetical protein
MELRFLNKLDPKKTNYTFDDLKQMVMNNRESDKIVRVLLEGGMSVEDINKYHQFDGFHTVRVVDVVDIDAFIIN